MTDQPDPQIPHPHNEAQWRAYLNGADPAARAGRSLWQKLPSPPRCELCAAPFRGPFAPLLRLIGKRPFTKNPRYCDFCMSRLIKAEGGAEIEMSALFADVRGSTPLAEQLGPTRMREVVDRFYTAGVDVLCQGGAMVDRFMGDQIVGYFVPLYAQSHARSAIDTGLALLRATGNVVGKQPWIPIGIGVHTGNAFVGTVGRASGLLELTAIGESINVAARLASVAEPGELVCSEAAYAAAGVTQPAESRELTLKGVTAAVAVRVLKAN
jgi:adenylate cyclase